MNVTNQEIVGHTDQLKKDKGSQRKQNMDDRLDHEKGHKNT